MDNEYYLCGIIVVVQWGSETARTIAREMNVLAFLNNFANACVGSTRCSDNVALVMSDRIELKRCELVGGLSSHVHDRVDNFADQAKVLLVIYLLYFFLLFCSILRPAI